jgi:hypothetical protein
LLDWVLGKVPAIHTESIRWTTMRMLWGVYPSRKLRKIASFPIATLRAVGTLADFALMGDGVQQARKGESDEIEP